MYIYIYIYIYAHTYIRYKQLSYIRHMHLLSNLKQHLFAFETTKLSAPGRRGEGARHMYVYVNIIVSLSLSIYM